MPLRERTEPERDGHVDERAIVRAQPVKGERGQVREQRIGPVGEHRGHPVALAGQAAMPDGIDTSMHAVQPARARPPGHRLAAQAEVGSAGASGDDPMLTGGELGDPPLPMGFMRFVNSWLTNFGHPLR